MYTITTVKKINKDNTVQVGCSNKACQGCKAEMFCNNKDFTEFVARNDNHLDLQVGQEVELFLPPGKTILSTALVFALPLCLFPLGYIFTKNMFHLNEIISALGGFAAMAVAFCVTSLINIRHKKNLMPIVERVITNK